MPDIVTNVLYQDIDRLQEKVKELEAENRRLAALNDTFPPEIARLEDRVSEEYEAERADDRARIKELEAERDTWHDRAIAVAAHLDYETTCDNIKIWVYEHKEKVRAIDKRIEELEAENKRLREALDRIESMATIENTEIQKIAREALKEASHEGHPIR